jgi:hypothetical protein
LDGPNRRDAAAWAESPSAPENRNKEEGSPWCDSEKGSDRWIIDDSSYDSDRSHEVEGVPAALAVMLQENATGKVAGPHVGATFVAAASAEKLTPIETTNEKGREREHCIDNSKL